MEGEPLAPTVEGVPLVGVAEGEDGRNGVVGGETEDSPRTVLVVHGDGAARDTFGPSGEHHVLRSAACVEGATAGHEDERHRQRRRR